MKFAVICPIPMLQDYATVSTYHMALTHLVAQSVNYTQFYKRRSNAGDYVMLDNSLIELGKSVTMEDVLRAAEAIQANEIVLPDVYKSHEGTVKAVEDALYKYPKELKKYKLMAVCHGSDPSDWLSCHNHLVSIPEINTIGIPKVASTFSQFNNMGRVRLCSTMEQNGLRSKKKEYHLLGVWNNPWPEIQQLSTLKWIRGVDTVLPVLMGIKGIAFDQHGLAIDRPVSAVDFESCLNPHPDIIERNIFKMLKWGNSL